MTSLIIPTLNEAANLPELARRLPAVQEVIVVDDGSTDDTVAVARSLGWRVIEREEPEGGGDGLGGAVLAGIEAAGGEVVCVIDADLQHPPEAVAVLVAAVEGGADLAIGSRYVAGGSVGEDWTTRRRLMSRAATWLARPFAAGVKDPMSGFFALRREAVLAAEHLSPLGYKVGLELLCKTRPGRVVEVPIHFATRHAGDSKLTTREQFRYLEHLSRLYDFTFPRLSPVVKFLIVTLAQAAAAFAVFALAVWVGVAVVPAAVVALLVGVAVVALFHARYVRTQRPFLVRPTPWRDFVISAAVEVLVGAAVAAYLHGRGYNDSCGERRSSSARSLWGSRSTSHSRRAGSLRPTG